VLVNFSAQLNGNKVNLFWQVQSEGDNLGFVIQRRSENAGWQNIGFVKSMESTRDYHSYTYADETSSCGMNYYRLKQIGKNSDNSILAESKILVK